MVDLPAAKAGQNARRQRGTAGEPSYDASHVTAAGGCARDGRNPE